MASKSKFSMQLNSTKKKGKTYGLVVPKKKQAAVANKPLSLFSSADEPDEQNNLSAKQRMNLQLQAISSKSTQQISKAQQQALEQDAAVFDYDGVYDDIQHSREEQKQAAIASREANKKKSRYIGALLDKSKIRERENERIREKILLKERQKEDALYGDKEKFITSAYKKRLMEQKRWEEEDKRLDDIERAEDVTTRKGGMANFYANMNKNIAMGASVEENARSEYTVGKRSAPAVNDEVETQEPQPKQRKVSSPPGRAPEPEPAAAKPTAIPSKDEPSAEVQAETTAQEKQDRIAAAKARYLARKQQRS